MRGDWFVDAFAAELDRLLSELKSGDRGAPSVELSEWWVPSLPPPRDAPLAAIDGGGGFEPLVGGSAFYVARAIAVFNPIGDPVKVVDARVYPARDTRILDALRALTELRAALRALERLPRGERAFMLMDGSYRALVSAALGAIRRGARGQGSLSSLYVGLASLELITVLWKLLGTAFEKGVNVVFVSKDSGYRSFKEAVLLRLLAKRAEAHGVEELALLAERCYSSYPLGRLRERLLAWRKSVEGELRALLDMILDLGYRDVLFIDDYTGGAPGYTRPLEVSLGGLYGSSIERHAVRMCERVEEYIGGREAENCRGLLDDAVVAYESLPSTRMMYVRLAPRDELLLVETMGEGRLAGEGRRLSEVREEDEATLSLLVAGYAGPRFYNKWLVAAHEAATMRSEQMVLYARLFDALARSRGINLRLARRTWVGVTGIA